LQFTYPKASLKDAQATGEASTLKKEHPAHQNMKIFYFFLFLWVIFVSPVPDSGTQINADPDPQNPAPPGGH
jgi:hypothetical protein